MTQNAAANNPDPMPTAPACLERLLSRRSTRRYRKDPVAPAMVEQLLRAAMAAPSAGNEQPWKFIVVDDPAIMLATAADGGMRMLAEAPIAILVCGEPRLAKYKGFWFQDCAAATQNILLAAHFLGLGAAWMGLYPIGYRMRRIRRVIGLPQRIVPFAFVSVGLSAEGKPKADHFDQRRVHRNRWSPGQDREIEITFSQAALLLAKRHVRNMLRR